MPPPSLLHRTLVPLSLVALLTLTGCKPDAAVRKAEPLNAASSSASTPTGTPVDPATVGSVTGTVSLTGAPPPRVHIDMSQDPVCSITGGDNLSEQFVVDHGRLANVFVFVKSGPAAAMNAAPLSTAPVILDQKGCQYRPHVIAVLRGGTVDFRNSDPTMHNIHTMPTTVGNETIDVSQGPGGAPQLRHFNAPELMLPVRCNNHPWMNAFINVSATPFFAVSDATGTFTLRSLPAGHYTLAAVHEKLGEKDIDLDITPQTATKAAFTFTAK